MAERPRVVITTPPGGWPAPWDEVAGIAAVLSSSCWSLIGGLMVQLWALHHGVGRIRPTRDVDMIVHVETGARHVADVVAGLRELGYALQPSIDPRTRTAHRFGRGDATVDVVVADHAAPRVVPTLSGHPMVRVAGGTQALRRTVDATLIITPPMRTSISVPDAYGALMLKAAAHRADSREPLRHLQDAATLLACLEDPFEERGASGGDRSRLLHLQRALDDPRTDAWRTLAPDERQRGRDALAVLCALD